MLTRRSMIRALGFGAPAAAVAAAFGLPKPANGGYVLSTADYAVGEAGIPWADYKDAAIAAPKLSVAELEAVSANIGQIVAGEIKERGPLAREMERAYGLRRSLA
ncbi:hypothetical protein [Ancylobacter sp. IITR112]|uniref:hypothetical protein n=1 Tax=Ancylobacter sp. IITR112 TaxID=3138073 RepID=UPI00352BB0E9